MHYPTTTTRGRWDSTQEHTLQAGDADQPGALVQKGGEMGRGRDPIQGSTFPQAHHSIPGHLACLALTLPGAGPRDRRGWGGAGVAI